MKPTVTKASSSENLAPIRHHLGSVCFFGDGFTLGLGVDPGDSWPVQLARQTRHRGFGMLPYNLGVPADSTESLLARWRVESDVRFGGSSKGALVFCFGLADMADTVQQGICLPLPMSLANAEEMMIEAAMTKPTFWIGPPPILSETPSVLEMGRRLSYHRGRVAALNEGYRDIAQTNGIPYLDLFAALADDAAWRQSLQSSNGVYPTASGHSQVARCVVEWSAWQGRLMKPARMAIVEAGSGNDDATPRKWEPAELVAASGFAAE